MAGTEAARQAIWLQDMLGGNTSEQVVIRTNNQSAISLTRNPVFHAHSISLHKRVCRERAN